MNYLTNLALKLVKGLEDFKGWEEVVSSTASEIATSLARVVLKAIDDELVKTRDKSLGMVGFREKTVVAKFGESKKLASIF